VRESLTGHPVAPVANEFLSGDVALKLATDAERPMVALPEEDGSE